MKTLIKYLLKEDTVIFFDLEKIDTVSTMRNGIERWKMEKICIQQLLLLSYFNSLSLKRV